MKTLIFLLVSIISCQSALRLDGTTAWAGRVSDAQVVPFAPGTSITISMWVKRFVTNYAGLDSSNVHDIGGGEGNHVLAINNTKTNRLEFSYQNTSDASLQTYATVGGVMSTTNVWTHIVWSYAFATANSAVWYIDGVAQTGAWITGTGGVGPFQTHQPRVGTDNYSHFFAGEISEYCIYANQNLNYQEVQTLAKSKVKRIAIQLRADKVNGTSTGFHGPCAYFPMDYYNVANTVTNNVKDIGSYNRPLSTVGTASWTVESVCSYPPNE